jgi:hypothetical protein
MELLWAWSRKLTKPLSGRPDLQRFTSRRIPAPLLKVVSNPPPSSPKEQKQDNDQKHDADTAIAVVANTGTHVVAAATEHEQENHENVN